MSTLTLPALLLLLSLFGGKTTVAFNQVKGMLYKKCDETQVISMVESKYDASFKDRQWNTACKNLKQLSGCSWSPLFFLTSGEIKFNCPANQVINAIYSGYDHETKERNWSFRCCGASNLVTFECSETPMINFFKENFIWPVPGDNYLTGVTTYFSNGDGDHRWGFSYCRGIDLDGVTINSKIISSNSPISHYMEEGDVMKSTKRNANVCSNCKWPKINGLVNVPYKLTEDFSSDEKQQIQNSMSSFHLNTCVRFVPQSTQSSWVNIVKNSGCWSWIGRTGGRQDLSLGSGCVTHGIIQHELIHALGFWHEQSRTDRDLYVRIHLENVLDGYQRNFDLHETNNLNVPYDYSSIMHYGSLDFSRNNRFTITPIQTSATIGQRVQMTENDILKINKLYDCDSYLHKDGEWDNKLGEPFTTKCPRGQAISHITSSYNSQWKDRNWAFKCKGFEETWQCYWSQYVNNYATGFDFQCGVGSAIAGIHSVFNSEMSDRRWKFYCCKPSFSLIEHQVTPFFNYWHEYFSWKVAGKNFITGVKSIYDTQEGDHRWSFKYSQRGS